MKKICSIFLVFILLISAITPATSAQQPIKVTLDGSPVSFDAQPFIENGRTLVPFRAIFEALGANVEWDEVNQMVTGAKDDKKISLKINSATATVNDNETQLDVPAKIRNGRTFVPTRFIAENLGVRVYWDSIASTVVLLTDAIDPTDDKKYLSKADFNRSTSGSMSIWHFNKDEAPLIEADFKEQYPNIRLQMTVVPDKDSQYVNRLTSAVRAGSGVPDVMTAEASMAKRFINMPDCFDDLTDKVGDIIGNMYPYTVDFGRDDSGKIRALSYQLTAGAIGYKRKVAKKYLGTEDPAKISEMLSTPEKILSTAKILKEKSGGKVALFSSWDELKNVYLGGRSKGWVVNNKLNIDQKVSDLIDLAKTLRVNKYETGFDAWSVGWSSAIASDETAMCWAIPTWGVPWIINSNDPKAPNSGRWGLAKPMFPYFWGGTWLGMYQESENKDIALGFVRYFVSNEEHLKQWSSNTGDIPNSKKLLKQYGGEAYRVDKITNQNLFSVFGSIAEGINGKNYTQYDDIMNVSFADCMKSYLAGKISSKEKVITEFKNEVKANLRDIEVN